MSAKFRQRRRLIADSPHAGNAPTAQIDNPASVATAMRSTQIQDATQYFGGTADDYHFPNEYAGGREYYHTEFATEHKPLAAPLGREPGIDYEIGGERGRVDALPYSLGVVSSDAVENFELTGEMAYLRRETEARMGVGAVQTADYMASLAVTYAAAASQYYPNEVSQADLVVNA